MTPSPPEARRPEHLLYHVKGLEPAMRELAEYTLAVEVELRELQEAASHFVESLLRTSPGHLNSPAGEELLRVLALAASSEEPG